MTVRAARRGCFEGGVDDFFDALMSAVQTRDEESEKVNGVLTCVGKK
ncbi:MAG: hypothetical protein L0H59_15500 [Tomitella sp.]|nr:hypothetical protein [Tomitella sp.]